MSSDPGACLRTHRAPDGMLDRARARATTRWRPSARSTWALVAAAAFAVGIGLGRWADSETQAEAGVVPVRLALHAPDAARVEVAGSWNGWRPEPMHRTSDGHFLTTQALPRGQHEYMFVVNGAEWVTDPTAVLVRDDGFGNLNAVLEI